jgi:2-methylcitrate synthase
MADIYKGLEGVIAGRTAISVINEEEGGARYRGYALHQLAERATFDEVAHLLIHGRLPSAAELKAYRETLHARRTLPEDLRSMLERLPGSAHPIDVMRTGCSFLGCLEPEGLENPQGMIADRLVAIFPAMLLYWYHFSHSGRRIETETDSESVAGHFLHLLHNRRPAPLHEQALEVSLMLYAEHEFSTSTFTARSIASTLSDFFSAVTGAIGALKGVLHGGANEAAMEMIDGYFTPDQAAAGVMDILDHGDRIMGFGHRVYKTSDPRSDIIEAWARRLCNMSPEGKRRYAVAERIDKVLRQEKKLFPNVDFYSALAYRQIGIPTALFTPLIVISRIAGWSAHIMEQRADNRLIRPSSEYIGPDARSVPSLSQRDDAQAV